MSKNKIFLPFLFSLIMMLAGVAVQFKKTEKAGNNDFRVYYKTSLRLHSAEWENVYTLKDGPFPYRYVPYTLPALTWMRLMPEASARKIWVILQSIGFALGFYFLYHSLIIVGSPWPLLSLSLTMILTFRQFMDSLYSGQVAGIVFLGFSLGLFFYLRKKRISDGVVNSVITSLKVLPGILLLHGLIKTPKKIHYLLAGVGLFLFFNLLFYIWLHSHSASGTFIDLWQNWLTIVQNDSAYFDGSTPKSQSLRAFILRLTGRSEAGELISKILVMLSITGLIVYWVQNKTQSLYAEAYSYCLGILGFILFMPESLPYQQFNVAIPLAFILGHPRIMKDRLYQLTIVAFMLFISFAATDIVGRNFSDWMQAQSLPFFAMILMCVTLLKHKEHQEYQS